MSRGSTHSFKRFARWTSTAVLLTGGLALAGQQLEIQATSHPIPELGTVRATITLLLLLSGLSLWLMVGSTAARRRRYARACAAVVAIGGLLGLLTAVLPTSSGGTFGWLAATADGLRLLFGGTLPINGSVSAFALGVALFLVEVDQSNRLRPSLLCALVVTAISLVAILGYAYGLEGLYRFGASPPLPLYAALSLGALGFAVLASSPDSGLMRMLNSDSAGGHVIRFLPAAVVAGPLVFGWLTLKLQQANVWDVSQTLSIFVLLNTSLLALVIVAVAGSLNHAESKRRRADQAIRIKTSYQTNLAHLAQRALQDVHPDRWLGEAAKLIATTLQVDYCEILEQGSTGLLALRAAAGWPDEDLQAVLGVETAHPVADYTVACGVPVIVEDLGRDTRFSQPCQERLRMAVSGMAVAVQRGQNRSQGVVAVYSKQPRTFTRDSIEFLQTVAVLLRTAIDRSQAEVALRQSEEKFANVFRCSPDSISLSTLPEGRLVDVNDSFLALTGYDRAALIGRTSEELQLLVGPGDHARLVEHARAGQRHVGVEIGFRRKGGDVRNALCFVELLRLWDRHFLVTLARDISERKRTQAMAEEANQQLRRNVLELERQAREISMLNDMSDLLHSSVTAAEASSIVVQFAGQLFPEDAGALYLLSQADNLFEAAGSWGGLAGDGTCFNASDCWALRRGRPHTVGDSNAGFRCPHVTTGHPVAYVCVPMVAQGETLGQLHVRLTPDPHTTELGVTPSFPEAKRRLAVTLAEHVALAMANLRLRQTLRAQSIRDQLTGLFNRRYMEESLERELRRASRSGSPLGVLLVDVDRLKHVNDAYGHEAGDRLLKTVSQFLQQSTRDNDILCRLGGDEFVLVMPGASLIATERRAEQLLSEIRGTAVDVSSDKRHRVTLSMGIAVFPEHATNAAALVHAADMALLHAKEMGRDRLAIWQPLDEPRSAGRVSI